MSSQSIQQFAVAFGDQKLHIETGRIAGLADGAVTVRYGDTMVLATAVVGKEPRDGVDFFPLLVDYEERLYAAGKISGSRWVKREGRPSENAILTARLIDRPIRPLFPKNYRHDVQVMVTVLVFDGQNDPDIIAMIAASAALLQTKAPFAGPIAAARVGLLNEKFILNPTRDQMKDSALDLVVAGTPDRVMMLEAGMREVPEAKVEAAIRFAQSHFAEIVKIQTEVAAAVTKERAEAVTGAVETVVVEDIHAAVSHELGDKLRDVLRHEREEERERRLREFEALALTQLEGRFKQIDIKTAFGALVDKEIRAAILDDDIRPDGRAIDEIRPLMIEAAVLPRVHGSALFARGQTQALSIVTLGSPGAEQWIETMEEEGVKRFMHHYNFPPYSTGEVRPMRFVSRREIGHGALGERALLPIIPDKEVFPYTIRVVSEVVSSNGSTSMAATCGAMLALLDAGVPVKANVAGIAMGLVTDATPGTKETPPTMTRWKILTDLQGLEDFAGDMDFKVAGTKAGVTAIQLDIKIHGLTSEIIHETLQRAHAARLKILDAMAKVLPAARPELSPFAPRITSLKIAVEKIGELIGPGGKVINKIITDHGGKEVLSIDIEDDGLVMVSSHDAAAAEAAVAMIRAITTDVEVGKIYEGEVKAIQKNRETGAEIGAIVQLTPGRDGMVHISEISHERIPRVSDVLKVGDTIPVLVKEIDRDRGRISLSYKAAKAAGAALSNSKEN